MAANCALVFINKKTLQPMMVAVLDYDYQLDDPAYNRDDCHRVPVPIETYNVCNCQQLVDVIEQSAVQLNIQMGVTLDGL